MSIDMIRFMRGEEIPAEKYPMRTLWSVIVASATLFWNVDCGTGDISLFE